jgi:riboflavin synthase
MFTGIIEETGTIVAVRLETGSAHLRIRAEKIPADIRIGDSININGVCLTATSFDSRGFTVDVVAETMKVTNLGGLTPGSKVNLERALSLNTRLGGHLVSGHIDGTGEITKLAPAGNSLLVSIKAGAPIMKYIVHKGSVAVDGISLTVAQKQEDQFMVSVIPHTASQTTLSSKKPGDLVNLECDLIGKYIENFLAKENQSEKPGIGMEFLKEHGYL